MPGALTLAPKPVLGDSPSNPLGVNRSIHFGANAYLKYNTDHPADGMLEDSPTSTVIPGPLPSATGHGTSPAPAGPPGVPINLSPPCAPPLPAWPIHPSLLTLPFPW